MGFKKYLNEGYEEDCTFGLVGHANHNFKRAWNNYIRTIRQGDIQSTKLALKDFQDQIDVVKEIGYEYGY